VYHRDRCLGGDAGDFSPDEFIEHQVADDHDALPLHGGDMFTDALFAHNVTIHSDRFLVMVHEI